MNYRNLLFIPFVLLLVSNGVPKLPKSIKKSYSFIPSGWSVVGKDTMTVQSFYMSNYEISNEQYKLYLDHIEKNGDKTAKEHSRIRNENWTTHHNSSAMAEQYHSHPAYAKFPVVNVTYQGAQGYCVFLSSKLNELFHKSGVQVRVRLPFHAEIVRAGVGDNHGRLYPWVFGGVKDEKGNSLSNYKNSDSSLGEDLKAGHSDVLAAVSSYFASPMGVFNLSGNAAEMTNLPGLAVGGSWRDAAQDVTLQSKVNYQDASCAVGFRVVFTWQAE